MTNQTNQNWSFEVVAIPQQNDSLELPTTTTKTTPVKVKIRMKKANKKGASRHGIISLPKMTSRIENTEKISVIHSDQTIMSFNMLMETDAKSKSCPKQQNKFFHLFKSGKCLGTRDEDENDPPYVREVPVSSNEIKSRRIQSQDNEKMKLSETKYDFKTTETITEAPVFLGKCRRGGCLDPPFAEDKYEYTPLTPQNQNVNEKYPNVVLENTELNNSEITMQISESMAKIDSQGIDINSTCMLYNVQSKSSLLHVKQSDSIITYPPEISSEELGLSCKTIRKTSAAISKASSELTDAYFMPPKINYRKISDKNKDVNKINKSGEINYTHKLKDNAISQCKESSLASHDVNLVSDMSNVSGVSEPLIQPEYKLMQIVEIPDSIIENNEIKGPPLFLKSGEARELNASEETIVYSNEKTQLSQSLNSFFDHLQQPKLGSVKDTRSMSLLEKVSTVNNDMYIPVPVSNTLQRSTGDSPKLKSITKLEKENNNVVKHSVTENKIESSCPLKDLQTHVSLSESFDTKDCISEYNAHDKLHKKFVECAKTNIKNTEEITTIVNSDILPELSNNVSSHSKPSAFDSYGYITPTNLSNGVMSKEDIVDPSELENTKSEFNEVQSPKSELQLTDSNVSEYNKKLRAYNLKDNSKNKMIEKTNQVKTIMQTALITSLSESKEQMSKISLQEQNKCTVHLNKSQSMQLNANENTKDINENETLNNSSTICEEVNEVPTEIISDINGDDVINAEKSKQLVIDVDFILNIKNKISSPSFGHLGINIEENKFPSEVDIDKLLFINSSNQAEGNNIKTVDNIKIEQLQINENVLADNIIITEDISTRISEIKATPTNHLSSNKIFIPIENEIQQTNAIEGIFKINNDNIIENDSIVKQGNIEENETISHVFNDLPYKYIVPVKTENSASVENISINISETRNKRIEHLNYDTESTSPLQNIKDDNSSKICENHLLNEKSDDEKFNENQTLQLLSGVLPSNLTINKKELSRIDSLNSSSINPKNALTYLDNLQLLHLENNISRKEAFDSFQKRSSNIEYYEKNISYTLEKIKTKDYTQRKVNNDKKDKIPLYKENKKCSLASLQSDVTKTIIVDLAFQIYLNDNNETVFKTVNISKEPNRMPHDSISVMKSVLNLSDNNKLSLAINSEVTLTIEIKKNTGYIDSEETPLKIKETFNDNSTQYSYTDNSHHVSMRNIQSLQKSLAAIYENDLVPVEKLIRNLVGEINNISKYKNLTKKKSIAAKKIKISKPTFNPNRCRCLKNEFRLG